MPMLCDVLATELCLTPSDVNWYLCDEFAGTDADESTLHLRIWSVAARQGIRSMAFGRKGHVFRLPLATFGLVE